MTPPLTYEWAVAGGVKSVHQPPQRDLFAVDLPPNNIQITVTVKITAADGHETTAITTYRPPTRWLARLQDLLWLERKAPLYQWQYNPRAADPGILPRGVARCR
jgi:hypothetical protein